jgi:hypothetical protein
VLLFVKAVAGNHLLFCPLSSLECARICKGGDSNGTDLWSDVFGIGLACYLFILSVVAIRTSVGGGWWMTRISCWSLRSLVLTGHLGSFNKMDVLRWL